MRLIPETAGSEMVALRDVGSSTASAMRMVPVEAGSLPFGQMPGLLPSDSLGGVPCRGEDVAIALSFGLDLVRRAAMLVRFDCTPCLGNRAAWDILRKKDGLALSGPSIVANRAADTRALTALLREAISCPQMGEPKDSPMSVERQSGGTALIVRVVPGPDLRAWPQDEVRTALMTITDPDQSLQVNDQELTRLYGLTRGEAALATRMIQGKSLEEAAAELFISAHTARTHLKRIFLKTDTHRQPELVVRLLSAVL